MLSTREASTATMARSYLLGHERYLLFLEFEAFDRLQGGISYFLSLSLVWLHCNVCCTVCVAAMEGIEPARVCRPP